MAKAKEAASSLGGAKQATLPAVARQQMHVVGSDTTYVAQVRMWRTPGSATGVGWLPTPVPLDYPLRDFLPLQPWLQW